MNAIYTDASFQNISNIANRYGISTDSVANLAHAIIASNGTMAQFNIPELGGGGQWMQGGMTMVGDMFNNGLKATVDGLCVELSNLLNQGGLQYKPLPQSQNLGGFQSANWWGDLGAPNSSGSQNGMSYAIFNNIGRLAIQLNGVVTVFDTLDHQIGGVGQQQGGNYSVSFTSQYGNVNLDTLPIVSGNGNQTEPIQQQEPINNQPQSNGYEQQQYSMEPCEPIQNTVSNSNVDEDIFAKIEKLAGLKDKNIISVDEFENRKSALLDRL